MYAHQFGAKVVDLAWLYDSIEKGWCQDTMSYPMIKSKTTRNVKASSPKDGRSQAAVISDKSSGNVRFLMVIKSYI